MSRYRRGRPFGPRRLAAVGAASMASALAVALTVGLHDAPNAEAAPPTFPTGFVYLEKIGTGTADKPERLSVDDLLGLAQVEAPEPGDDEQWRLFVLPDGYVQIQNGELSKSGKIDCLTADVSSTTTERTRVSTSPCNDPILAGHTQKWWFEDLGNSLVSIQAETLTTGAVLPDARFMTYPGTGGRPLLDPAPAGGVAADQTFHWRMTVVPGTEAKPALPDTPPAPAPAGKVPYQVGAVKNMKIINTDQNEGQLCLANLVGVPKLVACTQPDTDWEVKHVSYLGGDPANPMSGDGNVPQFQIRSVTADLCLARDGFPGVNMTVALEPCKDAGTDGNFKWHADWVYEQDPPGQYANYKRTPGIANGGFPHYNLGMVGSDGGVGTNGSRDLALGSGTDALDPSVGAAEAMTWQFTDLRSEVLGWPLS